MRWDNWHDEGEVRESSCAAVRMLDPTVLAAGPYTILTVTDFERRAHGTTDNRLCQDNLFMPGENVVWFQNLNHTFLLVFVRNPGHIRHASPAIQLYKIVGNVHKKDTRAWFGTTRPHVEAYDQQEAMMGDDFFTVHAGKIWTLRSAAFDYRGQMIVVEFVSRLMLNHMIKMQTVPEYLTSQLEERIGLK